ncbi:MAG: aminotransferase class IV [Spirochaetales bacterium]|nr:aminotransferase class IV [Spirochaetales bacterium]
MRYALHNGTLIDKARALLPVEQPEVLMSFGVYESLKVKGGRALFVEEHLERLFESAHILRLEHPFDEAHFIDGVHRLVEANGVDEATLRIQWFGGREPFSYAFYSPLPKYPSEYYREGVDVLTYPGERLFPRAKSSCLLLNYMARRESSEKGALEALFVDRNGLVPEGARSNLFAFGGGTLYTADENVLNGVTRKHILECCAEEGVKVVFESPVLKEILGKSFDGLFISSTSMGAIPLKTIDGQTVLKDPEGRENMISLTDRLNAYLSAREEADATRP